MMHLINLLLAASWYSGKMEGWYYFQEAEPQEEVLVTTPEEAYVALEEEKRKVQENLSLAILCPTKENVQSYVEKEGEMRLKGELFADVWGSVEEEEEDDA